MMKKARCIGSLTCFLLLGTACSEAISLTSQSTANPSTSPQLVHTQPPDTVYTQQQISAYFTNANADTLVEQELMITYQNVQQKISLALEALYQSADPDLISLTTAIDYHSVVFNPSTSVLNIDRGIDTKSFIAIIEEITWLCC